jgi:hypothetical protein
MMLIESALVKKKKVQGTVKEGMVSAENEKKQETEDKENHEEYEEDE